MTLRIICFFILIDVIIDAQLTNCPKNNIRFEKVLGLRPSNDNRPPILYKGDENEVAVTIQCIDKCNSNDECKSFVLVYNASTCYWFNNSIAGVEEYENELDLNAAWFVRVCLQVDKCDKSWVFERVPGATLVGNNTKVLPNAYTRTECQQNCLDETDFTCRAAKFKILENSDLNPNDDVKGRCILSDADRHILPSSFRASSFEEEYFGNQCYPTDNESNGEFCSYEEYSNATLMHIDVFYGNKTKEECQKLCETSEKFTCRGFSVESSNCYLHSEDSKVYGPKLLKENFSGKYFEKTPCLNVSISCTETYMTVKYTPRTQFMGRMYMEGYSEQPECFVKGSGFNVATLKLSLLSEQCGVITAISPNNRTFKAGTMILQYNPLVQTQGDRFIRVGCIFGNDSKVLAGTGITIVSAPNHGSPLIDSNGTSTPPGVEMRIVDLHTQEEVSSTQIGQELQLIIELKPADGSVDIWASHLVSMTEDTDTSILLLDDTGCPTNLQVFPALTRIVTNDTIKLVANFQAFKFSTSPIVRFSVIVQFCPKSCPPIICNNAGEEVGRTKRESTSLETIDGTKILHVNRSNFEKGENISPMPLEFVMLVKNPSPNSQRLVLRDGKILVAGYDYVSNEVCLDYSLFIGLIITWVLIQVIFIVCCVILVRRYKKHYEDESTTQSLEQLHKNFGFGFSNLENRRVHWADNGDYT